MTSKATKRRGFTLVELIVVLAVLTTLAAVLVPVVSGYVGDAQSTACRVNRASVKRDVSAGHAMYISGQDASASEADMIAARLQALGAGKSGTLYSGLCPNDGDYSVAILPNGTVTVTCSLHGGDAGAAPAIPAWSQGQSFAVGDTIVSGGVIFRCTRAHTSGTTSATRDPNVGANKSTWCAIGSPDGSPIPYSSVYRCAEAVEVLYNDKVYVRTAYDPPSTPTPYDGSLYWTLKP